MENVKSVLEYYIENKFWDDFDSNEELCMSTYRKITDHERFSAEELAFVTAILDDLLQNCDFEDVATITAEKLTASNWGD